MKKIFAGVLALSCTVVLSGCSFTKSLKSNHQGQNTEKKANMPTKSFFRNNEAKLADKTIKITGVKEVKTNDNKKLLVFIYTTKNTSNKVITPAGSWNSVFEVKQNKQKLKESSEKPNDVPNNPETSIGKNETVKNSMVFELVNDGPVSIHASEGINQNDVSSTPTTHDLSGNDLGSQVYNIKN